VTMARGYLTGNGDASVGTADHYQVTVHVARSALSEGRGRAGLPLESVRRLACDAETVVIVEDDEGQPPERRPQDPHGADRDQTGAVGARPGLPISRLRAYALR